MIVVVNQSQCYCVSGNASGLGLKLAAFRPPSAQQSSAAQQSPPSPATNGHTTRGAVRHCGTGNAVAAPAARSGSCALNGGSCLWSGRRLPAVGSTVRWDGWHMARPLAAVRAGRRPSDQGRRCVHCGLRRCRELRRGRRPSRDPDEHRRATRRWSSWAVPGAHGLGACWLTRGRPRATAGRCNA